MKSQNNMEMASIYICTLEDIKAALIPEFKEVLIEVLNENKNPKDSENNGTGTKYVTKKEAAKICKCSISTIDKMRREGLLQSITIPGSNKVLFRKSDVYNLIES